MKIFLSSITYHDCSVDLRERVSFAPEHIRMFLQMMDEKVEIEEAVVLQTCNRLEFYVYAADIFKYRECFERLIGEIRPKAVDTWRRYVKHCEGADAVRHLFSVSAGLDSQIPGEHQILSQVKSAYSDSVECLMSKFVFHRLFHCAFRAGKAVRSRTSINCGAVSVALAAVELARSRLNLSGRSAMIIGAGENAELVGRYLLKSGLAHLIIANRNIEKAQCLIQRLNAEGEAIELGEISSRLVDMDLVVGSTAASAPVLGYEAVAEALKNKSGELLIIDIAVPRDIDPKVSELADVSLYNIDDLNKQIDINKDNRGGELAKAEDIVNEFTEKFIQWYESLDIVPVISELRQYALGLAESQVRRYAKEFGNGDQEKLRLFAESLVKKILHGPISLLRDGCVEEPTLEQLRSVELIKKMFFFEGDSEQ